MKVTFPTSGNIVNPGNTGERVTFLNGPIYWSASTGAHPVVNSFLNRWGILGYEAITGMLGYPTTDEIVHADGVGRRQEFQRGAIYVAFQNAIGSAIRNGLIRDKWNAVGAHEPGSLLGYPIQDPLDLPDGQGRMSRFERGVIYWHPSTGAHPVSGTILFYWEQEGFESGVYGYPTTDESSGPLSVSQSFQNGDISFSLTSPVSQTFYDCTLSDTLPHVSTHEPTTVNIVTTGSCTDPKRKIEATVELWHTPDCGFGGCVQRKETKTDSIGDGSTSMVQEELQFATNMECHPGTYRVKTDWKITNDNGGILETTIRTRDVKLGFGTGGLDKLCGGGYA